MQLQLVTFPVMIFMKLSDCAMNIVILYGARLAWRIDVITTCGVLLQSFVYASTSHVTTLPCYGDGCIGSGFESMFAVS